MAPPCCRGRSLSCSLCGLNGALVPPAVFEIILAYLEKGSWQEAFFTVLPQRKGVVAVGWDATDPPKKDDETDSDSDPEATAQEERA